LLASELEAGSSSCEAVLSLKSIIALILGQVILQTIHKKPVPMD